MKKFIALYMMSADGMAKMMANFSPEEQKKGMEDWKQWQVNHSADIVEMGTPVGKNMRINKSGTSEVSNEIMGYSVVQAESAEAVSELFADNPHFLMPGAYIDVMPLVDME